LLINRNFLKKSLYRRLALFLGALGAVIVAFGINIEYMKKVT